VQLAWHKPTSEDLSASSEGFPGGYTVDKILTSYPELRREDVVAAVEYAANVVDEVQVIAR
jgi:uncharacterized protein (DUF433 family)